jgi:tRNA threonylcarbamoyladenosine biosynthesis protein TsaB
VLVLALESSSRRGSVALVEGGRLLSSAFHEQVNAHGERLVQLLDQVLSDSGRRRNELTHVAAGRGPGAFTGLRVGLGLAQGIGSALSVPVIGVGSLKAMAAAVPSAVAGARWSVLDARRGEVFLAAYDANGIELVAPRPVPFGAVVRVLMSFRNGELRQIPQHWLLGEATDAVPELSQIGHDFEVLRNQDTDLPSAAAVGRLASTIGVSCPGQLGSALPEYLREADAVLPNLPPSPLAKPRSLS